MDELNEKKFNDKNYLNGAHVAIGGTSPEEKIEYIPIEKIQQNRYQPRTVFDKEKLTELANSIKARGIDQPIAVRPLSIEEQGENGILFELVFGERRWRAAQLAGLSVIPAMIRETSVKNQKIAAVIENEQRENLGFVDRMNQFVMLKEELGSAEKIAAETGLTKRTIERYIKIGNDIKAVPELHEIVLKQAASMDYTSGEVLANYAGNIEKLRKSNKRDFDRILDHLKKAEIVNSRDWLEKKFAKNKTKEITAKEYVSVNEKEYTLHVKVKKAVPPSEEELQQIKDAFNRFIGLLTASKESAAISS